MGVPCHRPPTAPSTPYTGRVCPARASAPGAWAWPQAWPASWPPPPPCAASAPGGAGRRRPRRQERSPHQGRPSLQREVAMRSRVSAHGGGARSHPTQKEKTTAHGLTTSNDGRPVLGRRGWRRRRRRVPVALDQADVVAAKMVDLQAPYAIAKLEEGCPHVDRRPWAPGARLPASRAGGSWRPAQAGQGRAGREEVEDQHRRAGQEQVQTMWGEVEEGSREEDRAVPRRHGGGVVAELDLDRIREVHGRLERVEAAEAVVARPCRGTGGG